MRQVVEIRRLTIGVMKTSVEAVESYHKRRGLIVMLEEFIIFLCLKTRRKKYEMFCFSLKMNKLTLTFDLSFVRKISSYMFGTTQTTDDCTQIKAVSWPSLTMFQTVVMFWKTT